MYYANIGTPTKEILQADGSEFLNVPLSIMREKQGDETEDVQVETRNLSFPIDKPADEITQEITDVMTVYNQNKEREAANADHDAQQQVADESIEALKGLSIKPTRPDQPVDA